MFFGINLEMCLPDYDEQMKIKQQKEKERCENLKLKIDEVFNDFFTRKEKLCIQPYKELIYDFIRDNGNFDLVNNLKQLSNFVKIYYRVLMKTNVELDDYVYLQSLIRNFNNEITDTIVSKYKYYKDILISFATKKYNEQENNNDTSIKEIINKILDNVKNGNMEDFVYNPLLEKYIDASEQAKKIVCEELGINSIEEFKIVKNKELDAVENLLFINLHTNLNLTPYPKEKTAVKKNKTAFK